MGGNSKLADIILVCFLISITILFWDFGDNPGDLYDALYNSLDKTETIISPTSLIN